jgi:hypothetical protein
MIQARTKENRRHLLHLTRRAPLEFALALKGIILALTALALARDLRFKLYVMSFLNV